MGTLTVTEGYGVTIASATALPASGGFAVLRVAADRSMLHRSAAVLCVERPTGTRRLLPVEPLDGRDFGTATVDFLVPAMLLDAPLSLDLGDEIVSLPAVETAPAPAVDVASAYLAQQDELVDLDERVEHLRAELRDASDRAALAEDALSNATERFEMALILQRREVGVVADQLDDLRLDAARTEAGLRNELTAAQEELQETRARELAAAEEHAVALAAAQDELAAAKRAVADISLERRRLESRLGTSERAYADLEAERIADREAADRWLSMAIVSRDQLIARVKELELGRDAAAEPARLTNDERDMLMRRIDGLHRELHAAEERQRAEGEAAIQQLHTTLQAQQAASDRRVEEIERAAERRIEAAESSTAESVLGVRELDLDGLASVYAVAQRERSSAERHGKFDFAQRWDALARRMVDETERRQDPVAAGIGKLRTGRARVGRFVRGRSARARAEMVAAALERSV